MNLQCSTYTCGAGFTADTSKQSTACSGGTCTDSACCEPLVRDLPPACRGTLRGCCHTERRHGPWANAYITTLNPTHDVCRMQCSSYSCSAGLTGDPSNQGTVCPGGSCTDGFCCQSLPAPPVTCFAYTCMAGYSADPSKQSTTCPSGTCTNSFCCEPQVRGLRPAC